MSLVEMLSELDAVPTSHKDKKEEGEDSPKLAGMTLEEKCDAVWAMRMGGSSVKLIATYYGVSTSTVYRWLDQGLAIHRQRLENRPAADIITESLVFLRKCRDMFMYEAHTSKGKIEVDPKTGEIVRDDSNSALTKAKMLEGALKAEKLATDLMKDTGIIPKEPEKIYHTLRGDDVAEVSEKHPDERTDEELRRDVMELLKRGRRL